MTKGIIVNPNFKFYDWRKEAGLTIDDCTRLFNVTKRTVRDWDSGKREPPQAVFLCLQIFAGRLDFLGKNWTGFRIRPDCIESPEGDFIYHYEIRSLRYLYQAAGINRTGICTNLKRQEETPEPDKPVVPMRLRRIFN